MGCGASLNQSQRSKTASGDAGDGQTAKVVGETTTTQSKPSCHLSTDNPTPLIMCGPSGVGKSRLYDALLNHQLPKLRFRKALQMTTRPIREKEQDGVDYLFVDLAEFNKRMQEDAFRTVGVFKRNDTELYGMPCAQIKTTFDESKGEYVVPILDIDVDRAIRARDRCKGAWIFVLPPTVEELETRLVGRNDNMDQEKLKGRMHYGVNQVLEAMRSKDAWDLILTNDDLEGACKELKEFVEKFFCGEVAPGEGAAEKDLR